MKNKANSFIQPLKFEYLILNFWERILFHSIKELAIEGDY